MNKRKKTKPQEKGKEKIKSGTKETRLKWIIIAHL